MDISDTDTGTGTVVVETVDIIIGADVLYSMVRAVQQTHFLYSYSIYILYIYYIYTIHTTYTV